MLITDAADAHITITFSFTELSILNNALNEVCNGVHDLDHDDEFAARLGVSRDDARLLLREIHSAFGDPK